MRRNTALAILIGAGLLTAGCHKSAPTGQVVATVNGEDVTMQDLNAAIKEFQQQQQVPPGTDPKRLQNIVLAQLVNQKLLTQSAKKQGLDKSPDYLSATRRSNDQILVQLLARQLVGELPQPSAVDVENYISANASRFGGRTVLNLDQIRAPASASGPWVKEAKTLDAIAAKLTADGVKFERSAAQLDSATLPPPVYGQIAALPAGEPFVVNQNNVMIASVVTGKTPAPLDEEQARGVARNLLRRDNEQKTLTGWMESLTKSGKITYQPGFSAPPPGSAPSAVSNPTG